MSLARSLAGLVADLARFVVVAILAALVVASLAVALAPPVRRGLEALVAAGGF